MSFYLKNSISTSLPPSFEKTEENTPPVHQNAGSLGYIRKVERAAEPLRFHPYGGASKSPERMKTKIKTRVKKYPFYEGETQNGKRHGFGTFRYSAKAYYEGTWKEDLRHGYGKEVTLDKEGSILEYYEGDWAEDERNGRGKFVFEDKDCYEGQWLNGKSHGIGKYSCADGPSYEGQWENGIALSNLSHLGEALFFKILSGSEHCSPPDGYCLGVLIDYLEKEGELDLVSALKEAQKIFLWGGNLEEGKIEQILKKLTEDRKAQLFAAGTPDHAIGVNIIPDTSSDFAICEIFNTGEGLQFHRQHPQNPKKFQTMLQVKIPLSGLSADLIEGLCYQFGSIEFFYESILSLPGAERIESDSIAWQTEQKGNDCSLRWILALYKAKKGEAKYKTFIAKLKVDCKTQREQQRPLETILPA